MKMGRADFPMLVLQQNYTPKDISLLVESAQTYGYSETASGGPPETPWKLYTEKSRGALHPRQFLAVVRKEGREERYAIFQGEAPIEPVISDLEQITNGIVRGSGLYNIVYQLGGLSAYAVIGHSFALAVDSVMSEPIQLLSLDNPLGLSFLLSFGFSVASTALMFTAKTFMEKSMTRGLSKFTPGYNYGGAAWCAIENELAEHRRQEEKERLFEGIRAGTIRREEVVNGNRISINPS